jgi:acyl-CoA dehydrogenase
MPVDLSHEPHVAELARRAQFVRDVVIPEEERLGGVVRAGGKALHSRLQTAAKEAGLRLPAQGGATRGVAVDPGIPG